MKFLFRFSFLFFLLSFSLVAADLSDISVSHGKNQSTITLGFVGKPVYQISRLQNPERVVLDIRQSKFTAKLPQAFSAKNIVKVIRTSKPKDKYSRRLVFDLRKEGKVEHRLQQKKNKTYVLTLTITDIETPSGKNKIGPALKKEKSAVANKIIIAVDAGHGGQDPGAIGYRGLREKDVTLAITRKLATLLNDDAHFKAVLTRSGDYFVSVMGRSDVARRQKANLLVSIHADAAPNRKARGSSVWVLSNRRANSEMANWLEQHEKQSELLGGVGHVLANNQADPYLSQAVLDLQFGHSQRVGYDVAASVIRELGSIGTLHKRYPEHASLGVLRSPDIPSLLVETGFISNLAEERLLGSRAHQDKIASAIYKGLRAYFRIHPLQVKPSKLPIARQNPAIPATMRSKFSVHKVVKGDTLNRIAKRYGTSSGAIMQINNMKTTTVKLGQNLKIPQKPPL